MMMAMRRTGREILIGRGIVVSAVSKRKEAQVYVTTG